MEILPTLKMTSHLQENPKRWKSNQGICNSPVLVLRQVQLWTTNCELCKTAAPIDNEIHLFLSSSCLHAITSSEVN